MKPDLETIELDREELYAKLDQIERVMGSQFAQPFRQLLEWYATLLGILRDKTISIQRLKKLLFGSSSERTSSVLSDSSNSSAATEEGTGQQPQTTATATATPSAPTSSPAATDGSDLGQTSGGESPASSEDGNDTSREPVPGHGRNPADAYTGCEKVVVTHESLRPGDSCPDCSGGTVYRQSRWAPVVRLKGQAPVGGTVYQLERLRCHLCGKVMTATLPKEAGPDKYDATVVSVIATLRYAEGFPWSRLQRIQKLAGIPLPASTQWELVRDALPRGIQAAYDHLVWLAAQGDLVFNDDTIMRVVSLIEKKKKHEPLRDDAPDRTGVFTSGIVSHASGRPPIALFFTGPYHSGENLSDVLGKRQDELPPPIQMCDALSSNMPENLRVILANCLAHGRRNFVDVVAHFRTEVTYVLNCLKKVYKTDAEAHKDQLSPDERLRRHQEVSGPVMEELHRWLKKQFDDRNVEPNSSLGEAIRYMLRHWDKLTLFLRVPGAPLDNNTCERALKMAIRHRKNSLFYKTPRGARVGDIYMSLINTCYLAAADPFDYLTQLQRHSERVHASPGDWMPWNYQQQLGNADSGEQVISRSSGSDGQARTGPPPDG